MEGFQTFIDYVCIKAHFSDMKFIWKKNKSYNFFKIQSFLKRKDQHFFKKLERNYSERRMILEHIISGFLNNNSFWIGSCFDDEVIEYHQNRMKRIGALESIFSREMEILEFLLVDSKLTFNKAILTTGIKDPIIIQWWKELSFESWALLNHFSYFTDLWYPINPFQKQRRNNLHKYKYLLSLRERRYEQLNQTYQSIAQI